MTSVSQLQGVFNLALQFLKMEVIPGFSILFISELLFLAGFAGWIIFLILGAMSR